MSVVKGKQSGFLQIEEVNKLLSLDSVLMNKQLLNLERDLKILLFDTNDSYFKYGNLIVITDLLDSEVYIVKLCT